MSSRPTRPRGRRASRRRGCWPSCWAGIAARTSRCGGTSTGGWTSRPNSSSTRTTRSGCSNPIAPLDAEAKGKQVWRYGFPEQDYDVGRGEVYDPANKQARPNDSPFKWTVGEVVAIDPASRTLDLKRVVAEPHPRAIVPLDWVRTKDHQAALIDLGTWVADNGIQAAGPVRVARDLLFRLPPRTGQWIDEPLRRPDESRARRCAPPRPDPRPQHARDPGSARLRARPTPGHG